MSGGGKPDDFSPEELTQLVDGLNAEADADRAAQEGGQ